MNKWTRIVDKAIARNKRSITYTKKSSGTYVPGGSVTNTSTNYTIDAARVQDRLAGSNNGQFVVRDVTTYYVSVNSIAFEPKVNDLITDSTDVFTVTKVDKHFAGGELVLYILHC